MTNGVPTGMISLYDDKFRTEVGANNSEPSERERDVPRFFNRKEETNPPNLRVDEPGRRFGRADEGAVYYGKALPPELGPEAALSAEGVISEQLQPTISHPPQAATAAMTMAPTSHVTSGPSDRLCERPCDRNRRDAFRYGPQLTPAQIAAGAGLLPAPPLGGGSAVATAGMPAGWRWHYDTDSGHTYYQNCLTGQWTWTLPEPIAPGRLTTRCVLAFGAPHGPAVAVGRVVTVHAVGVLAHTGAEFWSTRPVATAAAVAGGGVGGGGGGFTFRVGEGGMIRGWEGCLGMRRNEVRRLEVPPLEGYGDEGFPAWRIPPHATLHFTLECVDVR